MQYLALASTLLTATFLASATPILPRACSTSPAYPESIGFPINYSISQSANGADKRDDTVTFAVPAGANTCALMVNFPAAYPITSSGNAQVFVFDANDSQVGTVTFASDPAGPTQVYINSFACETTMSYRLSIGSTTDAGSVAFADTAAAGLTMTYEC